MHSVWFGLVLTLHWQAFFAEHRRCLFLNVLNGVMGAREALCEAALLGFPVVFAVMGSYHDHRHGGLNALHISIQEGTGCAC